MADITIAGQSIPQLRIGNVIVERFFYRPRISPANI